jgi:hypothetical protein
MADNMRFTPERIEVRQGETVKFVVRNTGKVMHEFVIGTKAENDEARRADGEVPEHGARRALHGPCPAGQDRRDRLDLQPRWRVRVRLPDRRPLPGRHGRQDQVPMSRRTTLRRTPERKTIGTPACSPASASATWSRASSRRRSPRRRMATPTLACRRLPRRAAGRRRRSIGSSLDGVRVQRPRHRVCPSPSRSCG